MKKNRIRNTFTPGIRALTALILGFAVFAVNAQQLLYRDKISGDQAFAAKEYAVAASFYAKYRAEAEKASDREKMRDACGREIDALILGNMPKMARKSLAVYKEEFGGIKGFSLNLWEGDILLLEEKYAEAAAVFRKVAEGSTADDPRRQKALLALARAQEMMKDFSGAAESYRQAAPKYLPNAAKEEISFAGKILLRRILCFAQAGDLKTAYAELAELPAAATIADQDAYRLLGIYLLLKSDAVRNVPAPWKQALDALEKNNKEYDAPLMYALFSACADRMKGAGALELARQACEAAYQVSPTKDASFATVQRLVSILELEKEPQEAADLVLRSIKLFQTAAASPAVRFKAAGVLRRAGKLKDAETMYQSIASNPLADPELRLNAVWACAGTLSEMNQLDTAETFLKESLTSPGDRRKGKALFASICFRKGRFRKAAALYMELSKEYPASKTEYLANAAEACLSANMLQDALNCTETLSADKKDRRAVADSLYLRGRIFEKRMLYPKAIEYYLSYSRMPEARKHLAPEALFKAAKLSFMTEDRKSAEEFFSEFVRKYPADELAPAAVFWKIHSCRMRGAYPEMIAETNRLTEKYPASSEAVRALFLLADYYQQNGAPQEAEKVYNNIFKRDRSRELRAKVIAEKAMLAMLSGKMKEAEELLFDIFTAYSNTSVLAKAYFIHGNIRHSAGDFQQAVISYDRALKLNPDFLLRLAAAGAKADSLYAQAGIKNEPELYRKALRVYQDILALKNIPPSIRIRLLYNAGTCARKTLQNDSFALACFKEAAFMLTPSSGDHEKLWGTKAAEGVVSIAAERPVRARIESAKKVLEQLKKCGVISETAYQERMKMLDRFRRRVRRMPRPAGA